MRFVAVGAATALSVVAASAFAAPAQAATGSISGTVRNHSGGTVAQVGVQVRDASTGVVVASASTADNGSYSVGGLADGSYLLLFQPGPPGQASAGYSWQYWNGKMDVATADKVAVSAGGSTTGIDPVLEAAGSISGHVTDAAGNPAAGVCVGTVAYGDTPRTATTDSAGAYTIIDVQPGSYTVEFGDCANSPYVTRTYPSSVSVSAAQTTGAVDMTVQRYGSISGRVTQPDGSPWPVFCLAATPSGSDGFATAGSSSQSGDGTYALSRVVPGTYRVMFSSCGSYPFISSDPAAEYYSSTGDLTSPTDVTVGDGQQVTGVNMAVPRGAHISGTVTDRTGNPLPNAAVGAWAPDVPAAGDDASATGQFPEVWTDSSGHFTIAGLPTGHYRLSFRPNGSPDIAVWYHDAINEADGTAVAAHTGQDISGIDQILRVGGSLHGHVTGPSGAAVANAIVTAYPYPAGPTYPTVAPVTTTTGNDGSWSFDDIAAGPWIISAAPPDTTLAPRWYPSIADRGEAQAVAVPYNGTSADASITLPTASTITGRVTDPTGLPLSNACVDVRDPEHQHSIGVETTVQTDTLGTYRASGLNPGTYLIHLRPCSAGTYGSIFHGGVDVPSASPRVNVGAGAVAAAGTDALPAGGDITGVVTDSNGRGCCHVIATGPNGAEITGTRAADGSYRLNGLRTGNWTVHFQACNGVQPEFYNHAQTAQDATAVPVSSGQVTTGISTTLQSEPTTETSPCTDGPGVGNLTATAVDATTVHVAWTLPPQVGRYRRDYRVDVFNVDTGRYVGNASFTVPDTDAATTVAGLPTDHRYRIDITTEYDGIPSNYHAVSAVDITLGTPPSTTPPSSSPSPSPSPSPTSTSSTTMSGSSTPPEDNTPPTLTITGRPPAFSRSGAATIGFSVSDPDNAPGTLRTVCSLDGALGTACTSPTSYQQLADGTHTLAITAIDAAGNRSTQTAGWFIDTARPKASMTWPASAFTTPGTKTLRWTGTDTGSGIASFDIRWYSYDGTTRPRWHYPSAWQHTTARSAVVKLQPGLTYCFAVYSLDRARNSSGWAGSRCVATAVDDRDARASGPWRRTSSTAAYRTTLSTSSTRGAALSRTVHNAARAAVTAEVCRSCGSIGVYANTRLIRTFSLKATRAGLRTLAVSIPRQSSATLTWRVMSSGRRVSIDTIYAYFS